MNDRRGKRWLVLAVALTCAGQSGAAMGQGSSGQVGTLDTLAGPGFCDGPMVRDTRASAVGALAVGAGIVYFDTGPPDTGFVASAWADGASTVSGLPPVGRDWLEPDRALEVGPSASRIAADPDSGAVIASRNAIVQLRGPDRVVAGDPADDSYVASGDGGAAKSARFGSVRSIAADPDGNLFVADGIGEEAPGFRVRFINRSETPVVFYGGTPHELAVAPGAIDTIAGAATGGSSDDQASVGDLALEGVPPAMAATGDVLYVASSNEGLTGQRRSRVVAVNLSGTDKTVNGVPVGPASSATVAGGGASGFFGDGGDARAARFGYLPGIATDGSNLYLADSEHHRIRKVDEGGSISTIVGRGGTGPADGGFNGNGLPGTETRLNRPYDVKVGPDGLYISDRNNGQIRRLDESGVVRSTHGSSVGATWRCGTSAADAGVGDRLRQGAPRSVTADADGNVYFVGLYLPDVKRVTPDGLVASLAGKRQSEVCPRLPEPCQLGDNGPAGEARLDRPTAVVAAPDGVYVYDGGHRRIRFVNTSGEPVTAHGVAVLPDQVVTIAGTGFDGTGGDGGPALFATLSSDGALAFSPGGELIVVDLINERVRIVDPRGGISTIIDRTALGPCCERPIAAATGPDGNLYVLDGPSGRSASPGPSSPGSARVWFLNRGAEPVSVHGQNVDVGAFVPVAGNGDVGVPSEDVPALESNLQNPQGIAVDAQTLYIAEGTDGTVLRVGPDGRLRTLVGTGQRGSGSDGVPANRTPLQPSAISVDHCGNVLIADQSSDRVRRLNIVPPCPPPARASAPSSGLPGLAPLAIVAGVAMAGALVAGGRRRSRRAGRLSTVPD